MLAFAVTYHMVA